MGRLIPDISYGRLLGLIQAETLRLLTAPEKWFNVDNQKGGRSMQAYCVKCRAKKEMKSPKAITMKNGKPANQGTCLTCGTKMFKIGSK
jgi:hypothetical protein